MKPTQRPQNPCFSSGPTAKRPGWTPAALETALVGRSHRSKTGKARIQEVIDRSRALLGVPDDYHLGIVPASDTGAMEMALWSLLGARGVDMLSWESFGQGWVTDVTKQLKLTDVRVLEAGYGQLCDLSAVDWDRDVVFTWNGTTSGVRVPNGDWIPDDRGGLAICDATSAVFAMDVPIAKLDVVTYSWQKVLGGEAQHGVLILSPRAVERLESYKPAWPLPKIFRMTKGGTFSAAIFQADTINTPSMLVVEDALDGLRWAESLGGLPGLIKRSEANLAAVAAWVERTPVGGVPSRGPRHAFVHVDLHQDSRSLVPGPGAGRTDGCGEKDRVSARGRGRGLRHRHVSRGPSRHPSVGRSDRRDLRPRTALPLAGLGLGAGSGLASAGGCRRGAAARRAPRCQVCTKRTAPERWRFSRDHSGAACLSRWGGRAAGCYSVFSVSTALFAATVSPAGASVVTSSFMADFTSSEVSLRPFLKPVIERPSEEPRSGSFLGPKTRRSTITISTISHGPSQLGMRHLLYAIR